MGVIRHKIWFDVWQHKGRTLQVVLIIAIGAFTIGTTMGAQAYISQDINDAFLNNQKALTFHLICYIMSVCSFL